MYKCSDACLLMSVFKPVTANVVSAAKLSPMSRDCCLFSVNLMAEKNLFAFACETRLAEVLLSVASTYGGGGVWRSISKIFKTGGVETPPQF
jgi:hypothetical protein